MTPRESGRLWRFGAVVLFCGLPLLLVALTVGNLVEASATRALAARETATAAQIVKEVAGRRARTPEPRDSASLYLAASSASLARAELQERAGRFVEGAGGHLEEAQFTGTPEQENNGAVALQLSLTIGNGGLRDLLYAIETATPLLEATDLSVRPIKAETATGSGQQALLHVDLTIQGHFKKGTG